MFVDFNILNQLGSPSINSNTFANRPSAGQVGRLFVSTDTFEIYRDNGTGWDLIGGPGSSTVTGSGAAGQVTYWTGTNSVGGENNLWWDAANNHFGINTSTPGVALDVHSAADVGVQLNGTGGTPNIYIDFLQTGTSQYRLGYTDGAVDDRRFSIYDVTGAKEVLTIDKQTRYVGINFQYSSLTDQPQYMLDLSGGSFHTNIGQYLVGTPTDLTRSFAASGNANSIALWLEEYGNTVNSADIFFNKGRGTDIAKLPVLVGDDLGAISFSGYVNNTFISSLTMNVNVTNIDSVNNQANADFIITQSYNSPTRTENFRIIANGGNADIRGSVTAASFIPDSNTIPTNGMYLYSTNTLGFSTNSANILTLNTIGLGIFTTASYCIDVTNNSSGSFSTIRANNGFIGSSDGSQILLGNSQNFTNAYFRLNGGGNTSQSGAGSLNIGVTESSPIGFYTNNTIRATITNGGNFLIATTIDGGEKLQVNGTSRFLSTLAVSGSDIYIQTGGQGILSPNASRVITINNGAVEIGGTIKTAAPTTGTAATWKLGQRVAAAVVLDATQYIEVEVGGTFYKLAIVT